MGESNLSKEIAIIEHENIGNNSNMIITFLFLVQNQTILAYEIISPVQSQYENPQTDIYISKIQINSFNSFQNPRISSDNIEKSLYVSETFDFKGFVGFKFCGVQSYFFVNSSTNYCNKLPSWDILNLGYVTQTKFDANFDINSFQSNNTRAIFLKTGEIIVTCNYDNLQNLDNLNWGQIRKL